jgi:hypothetical protein
MIVVLRWILPETLPPHRTTVKYVVHIHHIFMSSRADLVLQTQTQLYKEPKTPRMVGVKNSLSAYTIRQIRLEATLWIRTAARQILV